MTIYNGNDNDDGNGNEKCFHDGGFEDANVDDDGDDVVDGDYDHVMVMVMMMVMMMIMVMTVSIKTELAHDSGEAKVCNTDITTGNHDRAMTPNTFYNSCNSHEYPGSRCCNCMYISERKTKGHETSRGLVGTTLRRCRNAGSQI